MSAKDAKDQFDHHLKRHFRENNVILNYFLDLGAAPGGWSRWLLQVNSVVKGIGVELPLSTGGRKIYVRGADHGQQGRYQVVYKDLMKVLDDNVALGGKLPGSMEVVMAGAIPNEVSRNSLESKSNHGSPIALLTTLNQLYLALLYLKPGGVFLTVAWKKAFLINSEIVLLLRDNFKELITGPGSKLFQIRSTYQLMALGFNPTKRQDLLKRVIRAIKKLQCLPKEFKVKDNGVLLFVEQTEEELFEKNREWLLGFYEPLWKFQSEAILARQKLLEKEHEERASRSPCSESSLSA